MKRLAAWLVLGTVALVALSAVVALNYVAATIEPEAWPAAGIVDVLLGSVVIVYVIDLVEWAWREVSE